MKLLETIELKIPEIKIIKFGKFADHRGYFMEHFRKSDLPLEKDIEFLQFNESYSKKGTFRGFHMQWNPYMGKLVRAIYGRIIDFALDVRKNSPTYGKIVAHSLQTNIESDSSEWIWLPPGFAHGVLATENTLIEYFCSAEYNPECEACLSPLSETIDWSLCEPDLKAEFDQIIPTTDLITDKDKNGILLKDWEKDERSENFIYGQL